MDGTDPLSQLADIHLPEPVGFWPPAPGWWVLFVVLCLTTYFVSKRSYASWRLRRTCSFALRELDACLQTFQQSIAGLNGEALDARRLDFVNDVNSVLRRVALKQFPDQAPAGIGGQDWIAFLRTHGNASMLDDRLAQTLSQGRFARHWDVDDKALYAMAHQWISSLYLARINPGVPSKDTSNPVSKHA